MPMRGAVYVLVRGSVKSLKWRLVFTRARYSALCSSSLCLKPCHTSTTLKSPGLTSMPMTLLSSLNRSRNASRDSWFGKKWRMTESKCRKDKYHDLRYGSGPPAEFRWVSMLRLSHWSGQHLLQWLQALGAQEIQWAQALKKNTDYRCTQCQGTARPLDGRPQGEVQVGPDNLEVEASFCYLGDMLSAAGGCEFSTTIGVKTAWKKFNELLPVLSSCHLSRHAAACTSLVCGKTNIMICGTGPDLLQSSGEFPCSVYRTGVGSIFCNGCKHWVHKKCSGLKCWKRTLITDVHSARELHAPWTADHRGNSKSDLTSWRWKLLFAT